MARGEYDLNLDASADDPLGALGRGLQALARGLARQRRELENLGRITEQLNAGIVLEDILEQVYFTFREVIPYNRIGFSLLVEEDGQTLVRARWAKTDQPEIMLGVGYEAPLEGSSLHHIAVTGEPRILNDLEAYYREHPTSEATRLILQEGVRSSLTCPLIANGVCIGFMFFSSVHPNTYQQGHVHIFRQIAGELALIVEKGHLVNRLLQEHAAVEEQNQQLQELNEMKNRFLGMAAHDMRNPLSVVLSASEYLLDESSGPLNEDQHHLASIINLCSKRMITLLNDLLDVHKIETGRLELTLDDVALEPLLHDAISMHTALAARKAITVVSGKTEPLVVHADANRIGQVIDNLIDNAVKYSPPGSTVTVSADHHDGHARVAVRDQGPGIPPEEHPRLFQDFSRLSTRPTGGEASTGLGLAICRRIVEAHKGEIGVISTPGQGSIFWFTLPLAKTGNNAA